MALVGIIVLLMLGGAVFLAIGWGKMEPAETKDEEQQLEDDLGSEE